ncbi:MAG: single-stranded-DNA-specific exonuclease RecJ [Armatimonadetes bacterium]|nr:single-stranded-DNA-specific exonuclease RecJ [Armatimonadota bacterium]
MSEPQPRSLTGARWTLKAADEAACETLRTQLTVSAVTARALVCRNLSDVAQARAFLSEDLADLADPFLMTDMESALAAVCSALTQQAHIRVYGDYDVDGVCATAMLVRALGGLGGKVDWYIPHRIDEGYGLNEEAVRQAHADGVKLLITVDCGTTAVEALSVATELGMEVVVTDHHRPGERLPQVPVLNPHRTGSHYPFPDLAGVGVAFKLVTALAQRLELPDRAEQRFLDLVCLGTIADVVPLRGENRLFVQHGLRRLAASRKIGLRALMDVARVGRNGTLGTHEVAFGLAPRINAAGRMQDAHAAVQLLLTQKEEEAYALARQLSGHNEARRAEERRTLEEALALVEAQVDLTKERAIVLAAEGWHPGVIGIVASRIVERYHRPTLLVAISDGLGKGSGRSIPAFNLWEGLRECSSSLLQYGGHRFAAGFSVRADRVDDLRKRLTEVADAQLTADDLVRQLEIDAEVPLEELTLDTVSELHRLQPFGMGNPSPRLASRGVRLEDVAQIGDGSHLSLRLRSERGAQAPAVWFRAGELRQDLEPGRIVDVCYRPRVDEWNGVARVQLHVEDIRVCD